MKWRATFGADWRSADRVTSESTPKEQCEGEQPNGNGKNDAKQQPAGYRSRTNELKRVVIRWVIRMAALRTLAPKDWLDRVAAISASI